MTCRFRDLATGMAGAALIAMAVPGESTAAVLPLFALALAGLGWAARGRAA